MTLKTFKEHLNEMSNQDVLTKHFTTLGEKLKKDFIKNIEKRMWREIEEFRTMLEKESKKFKKVDRYWEGGRSNAYKMANSRSFQFNRLLISAYTPFDNKEDGSFYVSSEFGPQKIVNKKKLKELVKRESESMAATFLGAFIQKNTEKISTIIKDKQLSKFDFSVSSSSLNGSGKVEFTDGSKFSMTFSTVLNVSKNGNFFYRWPTRFRNVFLSDGTKMKSPSEAKMKKEFA